MTVPKQNIELTVMPISGIDVAAVLGQDPRQVFKTLVTSSKTNKIYVFMIPVNQELDLKKAAVSVSEKSLSMLKSSELLPLTGYIHGGCSPLGMKKKYQTTIDLSAKDYNCIIFSAGKIGYQVQVNTTILETLIPAAFADLIVT